MRGVAGVNLRNVGPAAWRGLASRAWNLAKSPSPPSLNEIKDVRTAMRGLSADKFVESSLSGRAAARCLLVATSAFLECPAERRELLSPLVEHAANAVETLLGPVRAHRADIDG